VTASAGEVPVTIRIGDRTHVVASGRDGYLDVRLPADLEPGWATALLSVGDAEPVAAALRVVGPSTRLGVVSDVDDTVIQTMLPRPLVAFRNAFLVRETARRTVSGMAELYREILEAHPDAFVVYLSTGAWNTAPALTGFLDRHRYPPGPLLLTDWGPTPQGWFRSGQEHKRAQLARLFEELPDLQWLLVGDDGQHDPAVYAEAATEHPGRVVGIAIRELTAAEHVVVHGSPVASGSHDEVGPTPVSAPDGFGLREGLRARGLLAERAD
jgi:phosphatidate phosphatase APP1